MKTSIKFCMMAVIATFLCTTFTSCKFINPQQHALEQYRKVCEDIILNGNDCSNEAWEVYKEKHAQVSEEIYQYKADYTIDELNEIGRLEGRVSKVYLKREATESVKDIFEGVQDLVNEGIGFLEGLSQ